MKQIRKLCGPEFTILSGDDDKTLQMMLDVDIKSSGVISVVSNVAPKTVQDMCQSALRGEIERARSLATALKPLFDIVTVKTTEQIESGPVGFKARNPLPLMGILGLPGGALRQPLGKMTKQGLNIVLDQARKIETEHPEVFEPLEQFFDVNVNERLTDNRFRKGWYYDDY
jgi:4-hydroxy-tetrahydrodipicolinate synthase